MSANARAETKASRGSGPDGRITRDDIAAKLHTITGEAESQMEASKAMATWAIAAAVGLGILGAYLLGRRRGRKGRAVIEIKRV